MHKCLKCGAVYEDEAEELLKGCSKCGSKYFLYFKNRKALERYEELSKEEIKEIEKDVEEIIKSQDFKKDKTISFDIESIVVEKPGKYRINIEKIFKEKAIVVKVADGKYFIDLSKLKKGQ
ncbi:MAG: hypothetical protein GXN99_00880 [Candidatus Nanohaloarchaeota archaeon]|nr:hypothetical protein [Candidatus Nanohaloarchaeota archaeon]